MIKYRKAREIIDQVAEDLGSYDDQGLIDYSKLYKVIRKCNAVLGEKINPEKTEMVTISNYRGRLPEDFSNLNYALLCKTKKFNVTAPSGFQVEYKTLCEKKNGKCNPCLKECDNEHVIIQKCKEDWLEFSDLISVRVTTKSFKHCHASCPNLFVTHGTYIDIGDDGVITANFKEGDLFISYVGSMEDEDEDLLVIDHPLIEPYYEASLINQVLKLLLYNKEADVAQIYQDSLRDMGRARTQAISFYQTSGYTEIQNLFQAQRERLYNKYFAPIMGY